MNTLKLALEALETCKTTEFHGQNYDYDKVNEAIEKLKTEIDRYGEASAHMFTGDLKKFENIKTTTAIAYPFCTEAPDEETVPLFTRPAPKALSVNVDSIIPLYSTPPKSEPLTDSDIDKIANGVESILAHGIYTYLRKFARAIEKHVRGEK